LLSTFILHRGGYGLNGFFSLEEYHARDLKNYYGALAVHPHHNYYEGRAGADLTSWLTYFVGLLADVFSTAKDEALRLKDVRLLLNLNSCGGSITAPGLCWGSLPNRKRLPPRRLLELWAFQSAWRVT
jgi:hypothetical protein